MNLFKAFFAKNCDTACIFAVSLPYYSVSCFFTADSKLRPQIRCSAAGRLRSNHVRKADRKRDGKPKGKFTCTLGIPSSFSSACRKIDRPTSNIKIGFRVGFGEVLLTQKQPPRRPRINPRCSVPPASCPQCPSPQPPQFPHWRPDGRTCRGRTLPQRRGPASWG